MNKIDEFKKNTLPEKPNFYLRQRWKNSSLLIFRKTVLIKKILLTKTEILDFPDYQLTNDRRVNFRLSSIGFNLFKTVCPDIGGETTTVVIETKLEYCEFPKTLSYFCI